MKSKLKSGIYPILLCVGIGVVVFSVWADCNYSQFNGDPWLKTCNGQNCNVVIPEPIVCVVYFPPGVQTPGTPYTNIVEQSTTTGATCFYPQANAPGQCMGGTIVTLENVKQKQQPCTDCGG